MSQVVQVNQVLMVLLVRQVHPVPMVHVGKTVNQDKKVHKVNVDIPALWVDGHSPNIG